MGVWEIERFGSGQLVEAVALRMSFLTRVAGGRMVALRRSMVKLNARSSTFPRHIRPAAIACAIAAVSVCFWTMGVLQSAQPFVIITHKDILATSRLAMTRESLNELILVKVSVSPRVVHVPLINLLKHKFKIGDSARELLSDGRLATSKQLVESNIDVFDGTISTNDGVRLVFERGRVVAIEPAPLPVEPSTQRATGK